MCCVLSDCHQCGSESLGIKNGIPELICIAAMANKAKKGKNCGHISMHFIPYPCAYMYDLLWLFSSITTAVFGWLNKTQMVLQQGQNATLVIGYVKGNPVFINRLNLIFTDTGMDT